ncbi:MFS transporter [Propionicimonas sp.]|uniref:MFS transporter n=1 Tax=Propionicimonas sp. TaxID=1955623 RepID=UPI0039E463DC
MTAPTRDFEAPAVTFDRRLYPPMVLGSILNPVNSSMMAVALVPIGVAFGAPATQTAWLVSALYLATSIGQPVTGRLVDIFGPRRVFLIGAAFTAAAGLIGALAPSLAALVVSRVLLGFGTCAGYPSAMNLIRREARRTGRESPAGPLAVLTVANQTIAVLGPTLGGVLLAWGGWRVVFSVNLPLALACAVLSWLFLPRDEPAEPGDGRRRLDLDLTGMGLFAATLVAALVFLMDLADPVWWQLLVAIAAGAGFWLWEWRRAAPFIDVRVLVGNRALLATYLRTFLSAVTAYMFLYGVTGWLQSGYGLTPVQAGLLLLPTFLAAVAVTALTGRREQVRGKLVVSAVCQLAAAGLLLVVDPSSPVWLLGLVAGLVGIPQGLANLANQNALYRQAVPERIASSAGLLRTFMYLGAIAAASVNGLALTHGGLHELAAAMAVAAAGFLVLVVADRSLAQPGGRP